MGKVWASVPFKAAQLLCAVWLPRNPRSCRRFWLSAVGSAIWVQDGITNPGIRISYAMMLLFIMRRNYVAQYGNWFDSSHVLSTVTVLSHVSFSCFQTAGEIEPSQHCFPGLPPFPFSLWTREGHWYRVCPHWMVGGEDKKWQRKRIPNSCAMKIYEDLWSAFLSFVCD